MLNLKSYGATGNGTTDDKTAIQNWIAAMTSTGEEGYIPTGTYKSTERILFPLPQDDGKSIVIHGDGAYKSILDVHAAPTNQGPQIHFYTHSTTTPPSPTSTFPIISNMCFAGNTPGTLVALGLEDFSDNIGNANFTNVSFRNDNSTKGAESICLQLNFVFDSVFTNIVCVGNVGYGNALDLRHSQFNTFIGGSYSNAGRGVRIRATGDAHASIVNTFIGADIENVNYGIVSENPYAGGNVFTNTYFDIWRPDLSPPQNAPGYGVYSSASSTKGLIIEYPYLARGPQPLVDPNHAQNVFVKNP